MLSSQKEVGGEMILVDSWGNPLTGRDAVIYTNVIPIYAETIKELYTDQPETIASFLTAAAFFGIGVNTYEKKSKSKPNLSRQRLDTDVNIEDIDLEDIDVPDL
jgi:hypothetical protein